MGQSPPPGSAAEATGRKLYAVGSNAATNKVVRQVVNPNQAFSFGQWFWISMGNNWGPTPGDYTTPQKWGLSPGLYYFRGAITVQNTNAFAISPNKWFRVL